MLKATIDTLESIPEALREHYVRHEASGKFVLDVPDHRDHVKTLNGEAKAHREKAQALESKLAAYGGADPERVSSLADELRQSRQNEREALVNATLTVALARAKATGERMELLTQKLGQRITVETIDGKRAIRIGAADGTPMEGGKISDLVSEAVRTWPSLFESSAGFGSGAPVRGRAPGGGNTISRAEFDSLPAASQMAKVNSGVAVVD